MIAGDAPVAALRSDLARRPGSTDFGDATGVWIGYVSVLTRGARHPALLPALLEAFVVSMDGPPRAGVRVPQTDRAGLIREAYGALRAATIDEFSRITRSIAADMEDAGALALADAALQPLLSLRIEGAAIGAGAISRGERGRVIAHRARLARQLGDTDLARQRYQEVARLARAAKSRELAARAWIGFAVLALYRGNYPECGKWFARAARAADDANVAELSRTAHHGCLIVAAKRGAFDEALEHAWLAFRFSTGDPLLEAEALSNLGGVMADMRALKPALAAFEAALRRHPPARLAIPALGGALLTAARLGDPSRTRALLLELLRHVDAGAHEYEVADALVDASKALHLVGDHDAAEQIRRRALEMAASGGFHELQFRAEHAVEEANASAPARPQLSRASRDICERVEQLDRTDFLEPART